MPPTRIKICGLRDLPTAQAAIAAGAHWIGLVFAAQSPRHVSVAQARAIVQAVAGRVEPVGLFVDEPPEKMRAIAGQVGLRTVQLHGRETPDHVAALAPLHVIKYLPFNPAAMPATLAPWRQPPANLTALLIDAPTGDPALPGGSGAAFDWQALAECQRQGLFAGLPPLLLAGGLTPDNVARAIAIVQPLGVDVSSGVESRRGVKDVRLITAFCQAVHAADAPSL